MKNQLYLNCGRGFSPLPGSKFCAPSPFRPRIDSITPSTGATQGGELAVVRGLLGADPNGKVTIGGMPCDIFFTHCRSKGIYEFLDKAVASWPPEAKGGYICFLSNSQHADISQLLGQDPFEAALAYSTFMVAVANASTIIYTRIWCVYEAFLALIHQKKIRTAVEPLPGLHAALL